MAIVLRGADALISELERQKESLKDVDETIKKLTGRDPDQRPGPRRVTLGNPLEPRGRERLFMGTGRRSFGDGDGFPANRRNNLGAFSRLGQRIGGRGQRRPDSGDEEEDADKPAVQSSVIVTPKEVKSRSESIEEQNKDKRGNARNRRMFGLLLGTLQKFKEEAKEQQSKAEKRQVIEKKLEEKALQEKEEIRMERMKLFLDRRQKQSKIRRIEQKMEMINNHEEWTEETRKLENFIRTKGKPHVFFLPRVPSAASEKKLKQCKEFVNEMILERRKALEQEIEELMKEDIQAEDGNVEEMEHAEENDNTVTRSKQDDNGHAGIEAGNKTDDERRRRKSSGDDRHRKRQSLDETGGRDRIHDDRRSRRASGRSRSKDRDRSHDKPGDRSREKHGDEDADKRRDLDRRQKRASGDRHRSGDNDRTREKRRSGGDRDGTRSRSGERRRSEDGNKEADKAKEIDVTDETEFEANIKVEPNDVSINIESPHTPMEDQLDYFDVPVEGSDEMKTELLTEAMES